MTMKMLAATVRKAGTEAGLGGTEMGIAVSEMFKVHIFYWQPLRGNEFKLINLQRTTVQPLGLVHAEYIPGRDAASSHFNLLVPIGEVPMAALTLGLQEVSAGGSTARGKGAQVACKMESRPLALWVGRGCAWVVWGAHVPSRVQCHPASSTIPLLVPSRF